MAVNRLLSHALRAAHRGKQSRQGCLCAIGERAGQLRAPLGQRIKRLHERRVRRPALLLAGGTAQRVEVELLGLGEHGLDETRLADPERARDEQRAAVCGRGAPERGGRGAELAFTPFDRGMEEPDGADRRAARQFALERQRLLGGLGAQPRELVAQEAELARGGRPVAARHVSAHECAVGPLVGWVLGQHVVPATLRAHHREAALPQARARGEQPLLVGLVGQQLAAVGRIVAGLEALDIGGHLSGRRELHHSAAQHHRGALS